MRSGIHHVVHGALNVPSLRGHVHDADVIWVHRRCSVNIVPRRSPAKSAGGFWGTDRPADTNPLTDRASPPQKKTKSKQEANFTKNKSPAAITCRSAIIFLVNFWMPVSFFRTKNNRSRRLIFGETGHRYKENWRHDVEEKQIFYGAKLIQIGRWCEAFNFDEKLKS